MYHVAASQNCFSRAILELSDCLSCMFLKSWNCVSLAKYISVTCAISTDTVLKLPVIFRYDSAKRRPQSTWTSPTGAKLGNAVAKLRVNYQIYSRKCGSFDKLYSRYWCHNDDYGQLNIFFYLIISEKNNLLLISKKMSLKSKKSKNQQRVTKRENTPTLNSTELCRKSKFLETDYISLEDKSTPT